MATFYKNDSGSWVLVVLNEHGELLSTVQEPRFMPVVGMSISTEEGFFIVCEVSINYKDLSVVCYTEEYDLV